ncbi:MAG TPA: hypothetical protein VH008_18915 [Pseudonocardia sp.]|nr:hypothetical protein [Pseudonocardia sp.]
MNAISRRWLLRVLALLGAFVGVWACFAPLSWYDSFPGLGFRWLPPLGPYNEHLARDVGALYLALTALSAGAALRPADDYLVRLTGVVWLVFSVPHFVFHLLHLDMYGTLDQMLNVLTLGLFIVVGAVLVLPVRAGRQSADRVGNRAGRAR